MTTFKERLEKLHQDYVGETETLTDMDMVIGLLELLVNGFDEIKDHTHRIE